MLACDGLVVEETTLDSWLISVFRAAQREVPKAHAPTSLAGPTAIAPLRSARRLIGGARTLYWVWLAGAMLALALQ